VEPIEVVQRIYDAWAAGRHPWDLLHEDIEWDCPMVDVPHDSYRGHAGVAEFFRNWLGAWDDYQFGLEQLIEAPDGRVAALFWERGRGKGSGATVDLKPAGLWTVENGKAVRYCTRLDREETLREAGIDTKGVTA
jgi:ketosteroid isomerase-like protein